MSQFIESIRIEYGSLMEPSLHQKRMDNTLLHFGRKPFLKLNTIECPFEFLHIPIVKCRILYDFEQVIKIEFMPYSIKQINTILLVDVMGKEYSFKYADRQWINDILMSSGTDEIIMHDQGVVKDASYANLVFYDGYKWVTPAQPLLKGTKREILLNEEIIHEEHIHVEHLIKYTQVKFINSMMTWSDSPCLEIKLLSL